VLGINGSVQFTNKAFRNLFENVTGKTVPDILKLEEKTDDKFLSMIQKSLEMSESKSNKKLEDQAKTGMSFVDSIKNEVNIFEPIPGLFLQPSVQKIILPGNEMESYVLTLVDVTTFIEFDNFRKQFISTVSHELRTPISVICQSLNNIVKYKGKLSTKTREELFQTMIYNAEILQEILNDLSVISRIDEKRMWVQKKEFDVLNVIQRVISELEVKRMDKEIDIQVQTDKCNKIIGDPMKIAQIIRILLDNAIKYSPIKSKILLRILEGYKGEYNPKCLDGILIQVIDNGRGIDEKELPYIFERFYRAKNVQDVPGTGLGLPIAKELIQIHGGEIYVRSILGKGSTFSVFLPRIT
ncbi:MAG: sensor histidine kinase, partial [Candidatus Helarchaeales archaeon]